jgi:hypothetical protein
MKEIKFILHLVIVGPINHHLLQQCHVFKHNTFPRRQYRKLTSLHIFLDLSTFCFQYFNKLGKFQIVFKVLRKLIIQYGEQTFGSTHHLQMRQHLHHKIGLLNSHGVGGLPF